MSTLFQVWIVRYLSNILSCCCYPQQCFAGRPLLYFGISFFCSILKLISESDVLSWTQWDESFLAPPLSNIHLRLRVFVEHWTGTPTSIKLFLHCSRITFFFFFFNSNTSWIMLMMADHYGSGTNYIIVGCHLIFRIVRISDAKLRRHLFWVTKTRFKGPIWTFLSLILNSSKTDASGWRPTLPSISACQFLTNSNQIQIMRWLSWMTEGMHGTVILLPVTALFKYWHIETSSYTTRC